MARSSVRRARSRGAPWAALLGAFAACEPDLPDVPYACDVDGTCPEGFSCQATVCVRDGAEVGARRPMRVTWINAGEMTWFPSTLGGAALVVNEGFSDGARGLYEISVGTDGSVSEPRLILDFGEEFPTAAAVVALDDRRYGVLTMAFPGITSNFQRLAFYSVPRDGSGAPAELVAEPTEAVGFEGGVEPVYVGAVARNGGVDVSYADPSEGGRVIVARVEGGAIVPRVTLPLGTSFPLSADSLMWDLGDAVAVRVGLEEPALWRVPDGPSPVLGEPLVFDGLPIYAFADRVIVWSTSESEAGVTTSLDVYDWSGAKLDTIPNGTTQGGLEPYSATASGTGALLAPVSDDEGFATLGVARLEPSGSTSLVGAVTRASTDELYSARAFSQGGTVFVAWTSFHDSLMDLWVSVAPEAAP